VTHGREQSAEKVVAEIEHAARTETGQSALGQFFDTIGRA
jgi:hypothetical protein